MKIYKVCADFDKFDVCGVNKEACRKSYVLNHLEDFELHISFNGASQLKNWWPRVMERHNDKPKLGDYVSCFNGGVMILERQAIDILKSVMESIEILPLRCDFGDYWAINVLDVLECVDYERSEFLLLSDKLEDGRPHIYWFNKYSFIETKVEGYNIFKIIDMPHGHIFVTETFVNCVKKHGITGFKFEPI